MPYVACWLGPTVGNGILHILSRSAAPTLVYVAACCFACIFR